MIPFFSVIIPTYNRQDFLKIAIDSVLEQSFSDFELIICDDGSTDQTKKLVSHYHDSRILYLVQEHKGVSAARNLGLTKAKAEWVCFLDSDDRFCRDKLQITYQFIRQYPEYKIFHTEEIWYCSGKLLEQKSIHKKPCGQVFDNAVKICSISISTVALKKSIFTSIGNFDETMQACEDYDFWLRACCKEPIFLIPRYLTIKEGGHPDQQSKKFPAMDRFRINALEKILNTNELNKQQRQTALLELKKKCRIYVQGAIKRNNQDQVQYYENILKKFN